MGSVGAFAFHLTFITSPQLRPISHVMRRWVVNATVLTFTLIPVMHVEVDPADIRTKKGFGGLNSDFFHFNYSSLFAGRYGVHYA